MPAELRKRWGARVVTIEDRGDHAVIRPAPTDPLAASRGALKELLGTTGKSTEQLRDEMRREDNEAIDRR